MKNISEVVIIRKMFFQKTITIFFVQLIFSGSTVLAEGNCRYFFAKQKTVRGVEKIELRDNFFSYRDETYGFHFLASLTDGELLYSVRFVDAELNVRSVVRAATVFDRMIEHFGVQKIREIKEIWGSGTNLEMFYKNRENGMNEKEAILSTWSGRQAQKHGFTNVLYFEFFETDAPGAKLGVEALFTRPNYHPIELD